LDKPFFEPKVKGPPKKRKAQDSPARSSLTTSKVPKLDHTVSSERIDVSKPSEEATSIRRSARNKGKVVDYKLEQRTENPLSISFQAGIRVTGNEGPLGGTRNKRIHDPCAHIFVRLHKTRLIP
jgi:E3 ubiquitin-protein ligase UHRF1